MVKPRDITGQRFGRWLVIEETNKKRGKETIWLCKCECGNEISVRKNHLVSGASVSCGCKRIDAGHMVFEYNKENVFKENTNLNQLTSKPQKNSKSGVRGVYWREQDGLWLAKMIFNGEVVLRSYFKNIQDAINARKEAEEKYFKPMLEKYGKSEEVSE